MGYLHLQRSPCASQARVQQICPEMSWGTNAFSDKAPGPWQRPSSPAVHRSETPRCQCGHAPIKLYFWTLKFEFYIIGLCHELFFFDFLFQPFRKVSRPLTGANPMESAYPVLERPCPFGRWIPEDRFQGEEQALSRVEKGRAGRDMGPSTRAPVPPSLPPCCAEMEA